MKNQNHYKLKLFLIEAISEYKNRDCSFLNDSYEFDKIIDNIRIILGENFKIEHIKKYSNGITIFIPEIITYTNDMVFEYYRKNFSINIKNNICHFGISIQDYIRTNEKCNVFILNFSDKVAHEIDIVIIKKFQKNMDHYK